MWGNVFVGRPFYSGKLHFLCFSFFSTFSICSLGDVADSPKSSYSRSPSSPNQILPDESRIRRSGADHGDGEDEEDDIGMENNDKSPGNQRGKFKQNLI